MIMGRRAMKSNWLKIILAASLALNLAFVGTLVYNGFFTKTKETKPAAGAEEVGFDVRLKLGEEQKREIDVIVKEFRINMIKFKQDILEKRMDIIDQLGDPDCDLDSIDARTRELNEIEDRLNLAFVDTLVRINNILNSRQRLNFLYKLSQNWFFMKREQNAARRHQ